jgi:HAD superfamily hydrolase (TIGR01509 family)
VSGLAPGSPIVVGTMPLSHLRLASSSRRRLVALLMVGLFVVGGCRADATVTVVVDDEHGSGRVHVDVELDREALDRLEGIEQLRFDDLIAAGWEVDPAVELDDGGATVAARKPFADPAGMVEVLDEVSGPDGPYSRLGLRIERSFARTEYRFEGVLDGSVGVEPFADPALAAALDGMPFGLDLGELEAQLGVPVGSRVGLRLQVALPGSGNGEGQVTFTSYVDSDGRSHSVAVWETDLAADAPVPVLDTTSETRVQSIVLVVAAAAFAALFLFILLLWLVVGLRRRRRRRRAARVAAATPRPIDGATRRDPDDTPVPASAPPGAPEGGVPEAAAAPDGEEEAEQGPPPLKLVVIGGPGVAFGMRDPVDDLVAFARAHGSVLEYPRIADHYAEAELGRLSSAELWVAIGAEGDPATLDEELLGQYQLAPGMRDFVIRARSRGFQVAYLGDGPAAWADLFRRSFVLGDLMDPWVVSATVGARLPEPAMLEALRRMSSVEPASCLLIDDRLRVLEAARTAGFGTAWYSPTGRAKEAPGHSIIRGFTDLLSS